MNLSLPNNDVVRGILSLMMPYFKTSMLNNVTLLPNNEASMPYNAPLLPKDEAIIANNVTL